LGDHLSVEVGPSVQEMEEAFYKAEFGAIVADDVSAGSRVVMRSGTMIGTGSIIGSGAAVSGWIERGSRVV
jgi:acetyltransferase-like isoleucine patch superfamily enzyme